MLIRQSNKKILPTFAAVERIAIKRLYKANYSYSYRSANLSKYITLSIVF